MPPTSPSPSSSPPRPKPSFATPFPESTNSPILRLPLPAPIHHLTLIGRSRAAWHTSFVVPELNLLLDAGLFVSDKYRPKHIFVTHGHSDHALVLPGFTRRDDPPDVVCPREIAEMVDDFVLAKTMLNRGGLVKLEHAAEKGLMLGDDEDDEDDDHDHDDGGEANEKKQQKSKKTSKNGEKKIIIPHMPCREHRSPAERAFLNTHFTHAVSPGDIIPLARLPQITATVFACDHNVPSVGYLFSRTSQKLLPRYASLAPAELSALRRSGTPITAPHSTPLFAFLGDGTASTLLSAPAWLAGGVPLVITECSFLRDEHRAQAEKTKHTLWSDLEPVVRNHRTTTFVLTHFSLRYTEAEVVRFFKNMQDCPENLVVWADPAAADDG